MIVQPGSPIDEVDTPALIVDLDQMDANIAAMAELARHGHVALRPHVKSHKIPALAWQQMHAGAAGITCQKLGEAEVMADAGLSNILVPYPIIGPIKIQRLLDLAQRVQLTTVVDSFEGARALAAAAAARGLAIDTLVEVDVGYRRCGVPPEEALAVGHALADCPGLRLRGLLAYEGHIYDLAGAAAVAQAARKAYDTLSEVAGRMRSGNMPVKCVSVGATAGARVAADHPAVTELRAGSYIFNDRCQIVMGWAAEHQCALTVLATVVSVSAPDRAVIDAGSKALTFAPVPGVRGYGLIKGHEDAVIERLADEHGMISVPTEAEPLRLGQRVVIIPNSHTGVVNQFSDMVGVRAGHVECVWPIAARGRMQ